MRGSSDTSQAVGKIPIDCHDWGITYIDEKAIANKRDRLEFLLSQAIPNLIINGYRITVICFEIARLC